MSIVYVIPDTQSKEGVKNPLIPIAHHINYIRPSKVIHMGDHWDMPSLSQYDKGKRSHRVRTYLNDIQSGDEAMQTFWKGLKRLWPNHRQECEFIFLKGNHEERIQRALEYGPYELVDLINEHLPDLSLWHRVIPFLSVYKHEGIEFSHYFQNPGNGKAISTARQLLMKRHVSCVAGHKQGFDYAEMGLGSDKMIQALIVGSCYYHKEEYMGQNNNHFRGSIVLKNIREGTFDFSRFSLKALTERYG